MNHGTKGEYFRVLHVTICTFTSNQYRESKLQTVADISDEIIMQHIKDGELEEMSVLFERYHLRLYNFFLKLCLKMDVSQDLTQNLFYRMIKYKHTYKNEYSVKSWIYQMARNLHADYRKQEKKAQERLMNLEKFPNEIIDEKEGFIEEDYERLEQALSTLSDEQREVIVLSRYQGLKYEEISVITSQSVPAIKVAMHRAIKQLRGIYFRQI
jgi:RNA polymerase sigma factor (sigma-70 family)